MVTGPKYRELRRWMREQIWETIESEGGVQLPVVADEATTYVVAQGDDYLKELMSEMIHGVAYEIGMSIGKGSRQAVALGDEVVSKERFAEQAKSRWDRWLEHAGDRYVPFMQMGRSDLILAREERAKRAATELARVDLLDELIPKISGNQVVGDVFTPEEIETMYRRVRAKRNTIEEAA